MWVKGRDGGYGLGAKRTVEPFHDRDNSRAAREKVLLSLLKPRLDELLGGTGMKRTLASLRLRLGLAAVVGSAVLAVAGCSATDQGAQPRTAAGVVSAPAAAAEDTIENQSGVTFINDSGSTVWVSVEDGPQNVALPAGGELTQVADSYRITRDGGNIMLEMTWNYIDDLQTYQVLKARDGNGELCVDETWYYDGSGASIRPGDPPKREASCQGRKLTAERTSFDDNPLTLTLQGDNWK